jgi:putative flippase GtrA
MSAIDIQRLAAEARRGARFLAVGCGGLAVDSGVFLALNTHAVDRPVARAVWLIAATAVTWRLNRMFTFEASGRSQRDEAARYGLVALGAQGFNYLLFLGLGAMAPQIHPLLLIIVSAAAAALFSYAGQRMVTFAAAPRRSL